MTAWRLWAATLDDVDALARVHVLAWRETYPGLLPEAEIAAWTVERRAELWRGALTDPSAAGLVGQIVAVDGETVVGFVAAGRQSSPALRDSGYAGEIRGIYVLRAHQGRGIGSALLRAAAGALHEAGIDSAALWVLSGNHGARRFYEHYGGERLEGVGTSHAHGSACDVAYGWRSTEALARMGGIAR